MSRLTEEMVIARAKQSDLGLIKKLNCWGSDLTDVSIIRRMHGVEVLALSVNRINTLAPFEDCKNLQELYLRKNNIQNISDIGHLQNLSELKYLWLAENPCCDQAGPHYRKIVLRALPQLKKLDNIDVTQEEVDEALRDGDDLRQMPQEADDTYEDAYEVQQQPSQRPSHQSYTPQPTQQAITHQQVSPQQQHQQQQQMLQRQQMLQQQQHQQQQQAVQQYSQSRRSIASPTKEEFGTPTSSPHCNNSGRQNRPVSFHQQEEYYQTERPAYPAHYRHSQTDLTEWEEHQHQHQTPPNQYSSQMQLNHAHRKSLGPEREPAERYAYRNGNARENGDWEDAERTRIRRPESRYTEVPAAVLHNYAAAHRRPTNRSSNLLSATLCLVKELDYTSLEVVEHAVRCRIDELAAD